MARFPGTRRRAPSNSSSPRKRAGCGASVLKHDRRVDEDLVALPLRLLLILRLDVADRTLPLQGPRQDHDADEMAGLGLGGRGVDRVMPGLEPRFAGAVFM